MGSIVLPALVFPMLTNGPFGLLHVKMREPFAEQAILLIRFLLPLVNRRIT